MLIRAGRFSFIPPILIIVLILFLAVVFNMSVIDVRLQELDKTLSKVAKMQDVNKSLNMLAKYSIVKRRMERGSENDADYKLETKVMAVITSDFFKDTERELSAWNYVYPIVRFGINGIRFILRKEIEDHSEVEKDNKELEVAYFYERNRRYDKALAIYGSILAAKKHDFVLEAYIILHKGFCYSMVGNFKQAIVSYEDVVLRFPDSETAVVAWKLLEFVNSINDELAIANKNSKNNIAYGRKLYLLMDYKNAITIFSRITKNKKSRNQNAEAIFLKGRCHEELGETELAIDNYKNLMNKYSKTKWAAKANKRTFILGEFYERDKKITEIALKRLKEYQNDNFFEELNMFSGIIEESNVSDDLRLKERKKIKKELTKESSDILSMIDNIDLSGEKAAEKELEIAKKKAFKRASKDISKEVLDVNSHPLRKPSYIAREIKNKCKPLQNIYNMMLKRKAKFSGTIKIIFFIEASGKVSRVKLSEDSEITNSDFNSRVVKQVKKWRFPRIEKGYPAQKVTYPIKFTKTD